MLEGIRKAITDDNELPKEWQRLSSLGLLIFAFILALLPYKQEHLGGLWHTGVSLTPSLISAAIGLAMIGPLYLRGLLKWRRSPFTTVSFVLILGVISSFVEMALLGGKGLIGTMNFYAVLAAIVLSWIGMRGVAGVAWMIVLVVGVYNVHSVSSALGFRGYLYVCSAVMGLCFHSGLNPGEMMGSLKEEYSSKTAAIGIRIADDIKEATAHQSK